jgi:hypothetical protein
VRPDDEMKVVGHQAIGDDPQRQSDRGLNHRVQERRVILILMKDDRPSIASVEDMITEVALGCAKGTRHESQLSQEEMPTTSYSIFPSLVKI